MSFDPIVMEKTLDRFARINRSLAAVIDRAKECEEDEDFDRMERYLDAGDRIIDYSKSVQAMIRRVTGW